MCNWPKGERCDIKVKSVIKLKCYWGNNATLYFILLSLFFWDSGFQGTLL